MVNMAGQAFLQSFFVDHTNDSNHFVPRQFNIRLKQYKIVTIIVAAVAFVAIIVSGRTQYDMYKINNVISMLPQWSCLTLTQAKQGQKV